MIRVAVHGMVMLLLASACRLASGQQTLGVDGRQFPLNQYAPPGTAAQWSLQARRVCPQTPQQVRLHLPSEGRVTGFDRAFDRPVSSPAPVQMQLLTGTMYRFQVDRMPEFPNQEFYPSVELIDQLHPPPGQAERFPIEIELLLEELNWAAQGRLVTKVIYLEQPDRVPLQTLNHGPRVIDLAPAQNALAEADALGRPIAIVRLGGRLPDPHAPDPQFWGPLAPIQLVDPLPASVSSRLTDVPQPHDRSSASSRESWDTATRNRSVFPTGGR
jgi:hypothetical protein